MSRAEIDSGKLPSVEWLNFFVADVQTGLGPFLAAYLAAGGWNPSKVGFALTFGGLVTVALQTPAGAIIDAARNKRLLVAGNLIMLAFGAVLLMGQLKATSVFAAQLFIGASAAFLAPSIAAITLGLVGNQRFDRQFGRNQGFNSAGNVASALLIALVSYKFGYHAIFVTAVLFTIPSTIHCRGPRSHFRRAPRISFRLQNQTITGSSPSRRCRSATTRSPLFSPNSTLRNKPSRWLRTPHRFFTFNWRSRL